MVINGTAFNVTCVALVLTSMGCGLPRSAEMDLSVNESRRHAESEYLFTIVRWVAAIPGSVVGCGGAQRVRPGRVLRGRASYYSDSLAGNTTASGDIYRPRLLTAAHRTLPFGTLVRVTNLRNDRTVEVRINDRGPFGRRERIIDLSRRAAEELDMIRAGVVPVEVEILQVSGHD